MGLSLRERVAINQRNEKIADNSRNKAAFLALKQDIVLTLADGWSIKAIWKTLHMEGKITFSYKTFCLYVSRMITNIDKPATQENTREDERKKDKAKNEIKGFTFNPIPNLEELL